MTRLEQDLADQVARAIAEELDRELIYNTLWETTMQECQGWHPVELVWEKGKDTDYFWNEACAWAVENFGLPGENYVTHPDKDFMLFLFKHEKDAILMTLRWA